MTRKYIYLLLAVVGFIGPYYFFVLFLSAHGFDAALFIQQLFGTPISSFFAVDLLLSCVVFIVFLRTEAIRDAMRHRWLYLVALGTVGLSFALPLFLYFRECNRIGTSTKRTQQDMREPGAEHIVPVT